MDNFDKKTIGMMILMVVSVAILVAVLVITGYSVAKAVIGFFVIMGVILVASILSDYGENELARENPITENIESSDNPLLHNNICQTCGRLITYENNGCCPYCGAGVKKD